MAKTDSDSESSVPTKDETQRRRIDRPALENLATRLEAMRIADFVEIHGRPWNMIWRSFLAGLARGFGFTLGATVVVAVFMDILRRLVVIQMPLITDFLNQVLTALNKK